jgi:hypothetical protein
VEELSEATCRNFKVAAVQRTAGTVHYMVVSHRRPQTQDIKFSYFIQCVNSRVNVCFVHSCYGSHSKQ